MTATRKLMAPLVVVLGLLGWALARQQLHSGPILPISLCRWDPGALLPYKGIRLISSWQVDPLALVVVGLAMATYLIKSIGLSAPWPRGRTLAFAAANAVIVIATCSSIGVYDMTLFWVHMVQHLMLIMVAPPLLVLGRPLTLLGAGSGRVMRSGFVRAVTSPPAALAAYTVAIVGTHLTGVMNRIMQDAWLGQLEHLLYLVAGWLLFSVVIGDEPIPWRIGAPARLMMLAIAMAVDTFVGLVLMFSNSPIQMTMHTWGIRPLPDTHLGGSIMWVFGDMLMIVLVIVVAGEWARASRDGKDSTGGWLESARAARLDALTGTATATSDELAVDSDDAQLEAYNAWLAGLNQPPSS